MLHTTLGRWSVKLILVFFALFILVQIIAAFGRAVGAFDSNSLNVYQILMPIVIIPAGLCGIAGHWTHRSPIRARRVSFSALAAREATR